jgi:hypothetical protein
MRKRGQSAIEYLMTYGWAMLVVIGLGAVLWRMGVFNIGQDNTPGARGFSQVTPVDWKCMTDGTFSVRITNEAGVILNLSDANATIVDGGSGKCTGSMGGVPINVFRPAQSSTISFSGCPITATKGAYCRAELTLIYVNPASGITHVSFGKVWGPLE